MGSTLEYRINIVYRNGNKEAMFFSSDNYFHLRGRGTYKMKNNFNNFIEQFVDLKQSDKK